MNAENGNPVGVPSSKHSAQKVRNTDSLWFILPTVSCLMKGRGSETPAQLTEVMKSRLDTCTSAVSTPLCCKGKARSLCMPLSETLAVCHLVTPDGHSQDLRSCVGVGVTRTL